MRERVTTLFIFHISPLDHSQLVSMTTTSQPTLVGPCNPPPTAASRTHAWEDDGASGADPVRAPAHESANVANRGRESDDEDFDLEEGTKYDPEEDLQLREVTYARDLDHGFAVFEQRLNWVSGWAHLVIRLFMIVFQFLAAMTLSWTLSSDADPTDLQPGWGVWWPWPATLAFLVLSGLVEWLCQEHLDNLQPEERFLPAIRMYASQSLPAPAHKMTVSRGHLRDLFRRRERMFHSIQATAIPFWVFVMVFVALITEWLPTVEHHHTIRPLVAWLTAGSIVVLCLQVMLGLYLASPFEKSGPYPTAAPWELMQSIHSRCYDRVLITFLDATWLLQLVAVPGLPSALCVVVRIVVCLQMLAPIVTGALPIHKALWFFRGALLLFFDCPAFVIRVWTAVSVGFEAVDNLPSLILKNLLFMIWAVVELKKLRPDTELPHRQRYIRYREDALGRIFVPRE